MEGILLWYYSRRMFNHLSHCCVFSFVSTVLQVVRTQHRQNGNVIQDLKDHVDLRVIWGDGKILCPWHDDRNPSLHVYRDHVHCFSADCGITADGIKLVRQLHDMDFTEAVEFLRKYKGKKATSSIQENVQPLAWQVAAGYYNALMGEHGGAEGRQWLRMRGIRRPISRALRLGWTGRAVSIPHISGSKVWNIKYRVLPSYLMDGEPKYNSHKHQPFPTPYPWDFLESTFPFANVVFLTEGEFDTILLLQSGLPSLAVGGASHSLLKWKQYLHGKTFLVVYDQDGPGLRSARNLFEKRGRVQLSEMDKIGAKGYHLTWPIEWGTDVTEARKKLIPLLERQYERASIPF